ncbi:MAG: hypothetical protein GX030_10040 [Firmicutes bacterium]|nr:hypothetical protein [Bacillota bacterium]
MHATDILRQEHRQIKRVLRILDCAAAKVRAGEEVDLDLLRQGVKFAREYADMFHHGKEEELLFPRLREKGLPPGGPVDVMIREHVMGRDYVGEIDTILNTIVKGEGEDIATEDREELADAILRYTAHLSRHIQKEDMILFNIADQMLSGEEDAKLHREFTAADVDLMSEADQARWQEFIDTWEKTLELPEGEDQEPMPGCLAFMDSPDEAVDLIKKELKQED